jgi:uncharacterized protein YeaO (DUF488 family)
VKGFLAGKMKWKTFASSYRKEIAAQKSLLRTLKFMSDEGRPITLLCACEKPDQCHRRLLRDAIEKA